MLQAGGVRERTDTELSVKFSANVRVFNLLILMSCSRAKNFDDKGRVM